MVNSLLLVVNCLFFVGKLSVLVVCCHFLVIFTHVLTLKAPITTKFVCFCRLLKCLVAFPTNSVDSYQTAPIGAV